MNALATVSPDDLVAIVERARILLDEGDVQAALKLSQVVYDQAKAAGDSAARVKASRDLVDKARRMQADGLKIESLCYVAMADAVDAAQARGELSRRGRPAGTGGENPPDAGIFSLDDVGISSQRLSEARKLRNAVRENPDFIESVVEAKLAEGLEPTRAGIRHAIGTRSASNDDQGDKLYETPVEATRTLIALESFSQTFKEPFVGRAAILRVMEAAGYDGVISDLRDRGIVTRHGECQGVENFLTSLPGDTCGMDIVSNPPYGDDANRCLAHALRVHKPQKMAALLNLNFLCGFDDADRRFIMDENPPSRVYVFTRRLPMMHRDGWDGNKASSQMNTGWFVWERNDDGSYGRGNGRMEIIRVDWQDFQSAPALPPGENRFLDPEDFPEADESLDRETPRRTLEERVDEDRVRALIWIAEHDGFDAVSLRRGIGIRPSTADALVVSLHDGGLVDAVGDGTWTISEAGWLALQACAGAIVGIAAVEAVEAMKTPPKSSPQGGGLASRRAGKAVAA